MSYIGYKTANNVNSYLVSAISTNSTSIIVNDGGIFPTTFPYMLTIEQQENNQTIVREIVKAISISDNKITIERAAEPCVSDDTATPKIMSQLAHNFVAGAIVSLSMTAGILQDTQNGIDINASEIANTNSDITTLSERIDNIEEDLLLLKNS